MASIPETEARIRQGMSVLEGAADQLDAWRESVSEGAAILREVAGDMGSEGKLSTAVIHAMTAIAHSHEAEAGLREGVSQVELYIDVLYT